MLQSFIIKVNIYFCYLYSSAGRIIFCKNKGEMVMKLKGKFWPKHRRLRDVFYAVWNFWTSKTGAFILAVSAIALGYYQFYISRPILKYDTQTVNFISSNNDNDYSVKVHGQEYKDLYLTKVYLYNRGNLALSGSDVSKTGHDPIRIVIPKDAKMRHFNLDNNETTHAVTAKVIPQDNNLILDFDYLNPDYQIAANILHESPNPDIRIEGSALNVNAITKEWSANTLKYWGLGGLGLLYLILLLFYIFHHKSKKLSLKNL